MRLSFRYIFLILAIAKIAGSVHAQSPAVERPRLVVGIMVDGMQQKHLDLLWSYFDPHGFKKIVGLGTNLRNVSYNVVSAGNASDVAPVMTGSVPY